MRSFRPHFWVSLALALSACKSRPFAKVSDTSADDIYAGYEGVGLNANEEMGRRIWYEACGDNGRFHTYIMSQHFGVPANWWKVLGSANRDRRWSDWGLIPDPDPSCRPGDEQHGYGFDICKGDEGDDGGVVAPGKGYQGLLEFVGAKDKKYKDPGCWISGEFHADDCLLGLGTSTGALGYRKFPNPKFDPKRWPGWENYDPMDGSIEPPFLIGTSCGSCHISFSPNDPPSDPSHPKWRNIKGLVGNQWQNMTEIPASGADKTSLEWQAATHARIGTVDTSAHSNDLIYDPGTVNAIINFDRRPPGFPPFEGEDYRSFDKRILNRVTGAVETHRVFNILKGGEDDVGGAGAILRVYVNEGLCAEACWMNHLLDNRTIDGRGSFQSPFNQNQCRRDCPTYGVLEKHYTKVLDFFVSSAGRPTDLKDAISLGREAKAPLGENAPPDQKKDRYERLVNFLGKDDVMLGRRVFAKECAKCHSSQKPPPGQKNLEAFFVSLVEQAEEEANAHPDKPFPDPFLAENEAGVRLDWLGNDQRHPVDEIGTVRCRALHSNHMKGHVWEEFASETYRESPHPGDGVPELKGLEAGGRGYYRNVSLLSVWAQAPFMHNNAIGVELCNPQHMQPPCIDKDKIQLDDGRIVSNVSVEGRLKIFDESMRQLLSPELRGKKVSRLDADVIFPLGPQPDIDLESFEQVPGLGGLLKTVATSNLKEALHGVRLVIPKGTPVAIVGSLDYRRLANGLAQDLVDVPAKERPQAMLASLKALLGNPEAVVQKLKAGPNGANPNVYSGFSNCMDVIEDKGHEFGAELSPQEKKALIQFMKTL